MLPGAQGGLLVPTSLPSGGETETSGLGSWKKTAANGEREKREQH